MDAYQKGRPQKTSEKISLIYMKFIVCFFIKNILDTKYIRYHRKWCRFVLRVARSTLKISSCPPLLRRRRVCPPDDRHVEDAKLAPAGRAGALGAQPRLRLLLVLARSEPGGEGDILVKGG